jgi:hypothetical protein
MYQPELLSGEDEAYIAKSIQAKLELVPISTAYRQQETKITTS